jgi:nucleotide-binding universal stress UspA family protein
MACRRYARPLGRTSVRDGGGAAVDYVSGSGERADVIGVARVEAVHTMTDKPLLLCYDGSENAKHAIREAAALVAPRRAVVLTVWQDAAALPSLAWAGAALPDLEEVFAAAHEGARRQAEEGAGIARATGLDAIAIAAEAKGPIWAVVEQVAEEHDASAIVVGSRGLSGIKSLLLGSVSSGIVHHALRPTLVVAANDRG